ncbi:MAG: TrkH family potassium uptake protein [Alphaproteobacteria bacterium]|nr:TrkH family potassium uptake protein [Alphaproteobacteria bacterium]
MPAIRRLPFLVILTGVFALAMLVPMAHSIRLGDYFTARVFLDSAALFLILTGFIAFATATYQARVTAQGHLVSLMAAFILLPVMLAYPLTFLMPDTSFFALYFEMLSSLTTTGATLFDPSQLIEPVHLWRALVAWLGGFLVLVSAVSIMAPLNLGGFEVYARGSKTTSARDLVQIKTADVSERLVNFSRLLAPVYLVITGLLALGLMLNGERSFAAVVHAMSTISTSGISGTGGLAGNGAGVSGEILVFIFLFFAVSRVTFSFETGFPSLGKILRDHEFRLALGVVTVLPVILFLRHWIGAFGTSAQGNATEALKALWGSAFTVISFLTTTGFESVYWDASQNWSGLHTPGIFLIGLAVMGGGVATTAGGVKLLRVYALYQHSRRELQKLTFPSSVGGAGRTERSIRREGAYVAWIFFMLFAISLALVFLALTLTGLTFVQAIAFGVSALATTGPLAGMILGESTTYADLGTWGRAIVSVTMILGRMETLAIIALFNPEFWRS